MSWIIISRGHHEDVVAGLKEQINERDARLAALELAHQKLLDSIFKTNFGTQIYGTLPELAPQEEAEKPETDIERREREFREAHEEEVRELKSAMRTSPSRVPKILEEIKRREIVATMTTAKVSR